MTNPALSETDDTNTLADANEVLSSMDALSRVRWALQELPGRHVLSSSFGAQAAVLLHMTTREQPDIPVIVVDTGYLFPETYQFIDELTMRLKLNLSIYTPRVSPAWLEARHGRLWEQGVDEIGQYNSLHKVEPMQRALVDLGAGTWIAGLRRDQSSTRGGISPLELRGGRYKLHPLFDWTSRDVGMYLNQHGLPYHPLWEKGYVSIGDWHTTRPLQEAGSEEATRFFGLKRECGLHEFDI